MRIWPHLSINEEYQRLGGKGSLGDLQTLFLADYTEAYEADASNGTLSDRINTWLVRDLESNNENDNVVSLDIEESLLS